MEPETHEQCHNYVLKHSPMTTSRGIHEDFTPNAKLTGYKTVQYAHPIPGFSGFKPAFPHRIPPREHHEPCPHKACGLQASPCGAHPPPCDVQHGPPTSEMKDSFPRKCPEVMSTCEMARPAPFSQCITQTHPYVPFNHVEKINKTW